MLYRTDSVCPTCGATDIDIKARKQNRGETEGLKRGEVIWGNCLLCGEESYSHVDDVLEFIEAKPSTLRFICYCMK